MPSMPIIALLAASLSAILSTAFFVLESFMFAKPSGRAMFRVTPEQAEASKIWAFNQGFYNLFLAIEIALGIALVASGRAEAGRALVFFGCGSMVFAAIVLVLSGGKRFVTGALAQGLPPLVAIIALV